MVLLLVWFLCGLLIVPLLRVASAADRRMERMERESAGARVSSPSCREEVAPQVS